MSFGLFVAPRTIIWSVLEVSPSHNLFLPLSTARLTHIPRRPDKKRHSRHKLCFHHARHLVVAFGTLAEEGVDLVDKDDARLRLACKREEARDELVALPVPLVREHGRGDVDERRARLLGERLREHRLPAPGWAEEEHTLGGAEKRGGREEVWEAEGEDDGLAQGGNDGVQSADVFRRVLLSMRKGIRRMGADTHRRSGRQCRLGG